MAKSETEKRAAVVLAPHWPEKLESRGRYERPCDDKRYGRLAVTIGPDGDCWVSVTECEEEDFSDFRRSFGSRRRCAWTKRSAR